MKLLKELPPNRTYEQVKNHYLVEKAIAQKLMNTIDYEERKVIFARMYDELFAKVPDHPRLTRRESEKLSKEANRDKFNVLKNFVNKDTNLLEFAPGDCKFAIEMVSKVKSIVGVDISDQRGEAEKTLNNFNLVIYDGYNLGIEDNSIDVVFSDQLIEHFHPDDTVHHFKIIKKLLKKNGFYIFRTPHNYCGPSDVSGYFSYTPEGFHLKEWTYTELEKLLKELGYLECYGYTYLKQKCFKMPFIYYKVMELLLKPLPKKFRKKISRYFLRGVIIKVVK
ncbi:class I SAM-dependent methyltransferase [bacterium]|nr:class I SAM-dependent methyltransferase [bacterium]